METKREAQARRAWAAVRHSWLTSLRWVVLALLGGALSGKVAQNVFGLVPDPNWTAALQYTGIGLLLWATLGHVGWEIQTFKGTTTPERVNRWIYRSLHLIGSYLLAFSVSWPTAATFG